MNKLTLLIAHGRLYEEPYWVIPFQEAGFEVTAVSFGNEALKLLVGEQRQSFDVVFMADMMLISEDPSDKDLFNGEAEDGLLTGLAILQRMDKEEGSKPLVWISQSLPDDEIGVQLGDFTFVKEVIRECMLSGFEALASHIHKCSSQIHERLTV